MKRSSSQKLLHNIIDNVNADDKVDAENINTDIIEELSPISFSAEPDLSIHKGIKIHSFNEEIVNKNVEVVDDESSNDKMLGEDSEIVVPMVGMKFKDGDEIFEFYKSYAYQLGFPVRKRNSKKGDDGMLRYVTFSCSREGRRTSTTGTSLNPQPTIQTGCKARLTACSDICGTWRINRVHLEHNHKVCPSKSRLYRCNRQLSARLKRKLEVNDVTGIPLQRSYNSTVVEAGGYEKMTRVKQLRYEQLCFAFSKLADLVADNEERSKMVMEWIEFQTNALCTSKSQLNSGSNLHTQPNVQAGSENILDPKYSRSKGAPKKLLKKGHLETSSKKTKGCHKDERCL